MAITKRELLIKNVWVVTPTEKIAGLMTKEKAIFLTDKAKQKSAFFLKDDMRVGDIVLLVKGEFVLVGEITSEFEHNENYAPYRNRRSVRWANPQKIELSKDKSKEMSFLLPVNKDNSDPISKLEPQHKEAFANYHYVEASDKTIYPYDVFAAILSGLTLIFNTTSSGITKFLTYVINLVLPNVKAEGFIRYFVNFVLFAFCGLLFHKVLKKYFKKDFPVKKVIPVFLCIGLILNCALYLELIPQISEASNTATPIENEDEYNIVENDDSTVGNEENIVENEYTENDDEYEYEYGWPYALEEEDIFFGHPERYPAYYRSRHNYISLNDIPVQKTTFALLEEDAETSHLNYDEVRDPPVIFRLDPNAVDIHGDSYSAAFGGQETSKGQLNEYYLDGEYEYLTFTAFMNGEFRDKDPEDLFNATYLKVFCDDEQVFYYDVRQSYEPENVDIGGISLSDVKVLKIEILGNSYLRIGDCRLWLPDENY